MDRALLASLQDPASYPHRPHLVRMIETHISWVFIAAPFVFKVKKPVALGFLDFRTLENRRHFCERELALNRRLAPEIYLGVVPIYERGGRFSFEKSPGRVVEYALQMRELRQGFFLHQLLAKGMAGEGEIDRLVERLRAFYESGRPTPEIEAWGHPEKLKISTDENFEQVRPFLGQTISPTALEAVRAFTNDFYAAHRLLFERRIAEKRIRDCHGDLRLDHVHITPEAVTIFDCIEFNDRFRFIDLANDLAFLAMDFDFERAQLLGARFLRKASHALRDREMLKLMNFYKCYRAFVRGKVESLQQGEHCERARRYFHLALRYATVGSGPVVLAVTGPIASGKSTLARGLGSELGWPVCSSDVLRKSLAGLPLTERTAPEERARLYSDEMTDRTYGNLIGDGLSALTDDGGVILDATFPNRARREQLREECAKAGVSLRSLELSATREETVRRLRAREQSGTEVSDARLEDLEQLSATYDSPSASEPNVMRVETGADVAQTLKKALLSLVRREVQSTGDSI